MRSVEVESVSFEAWILKQQRGGRHYIEYRGECRMEGVLFVYCDIGET